MIFYSENVAIEAWNMVSLASNMMIRFRDQSRVKVLNCGIQAIV